MTRLELLKFLVGQAHANGFEFRRWFTGRLALPWKSADAALQVLDEHRHYYALLFSHEFAKTFWKPGAPVTFHIPAQTFTRSMPDGSIRTIERKPFLRRSSRPDAWRHHLRQMALAEEPLRYMRKYLHVADDAQDKSADIQAERQTPSSATLALARKAHERKMLRLNAKPIAVKSKRGARVPGTRPQST